MSFLFSLKSGSDENPGVLITRAEGDTPETQLSTQCLSLRSVGLTAFPPQPFLL